MSVKTFLLSFVIALAISLIVAAIWPDIPFAARLVCFALSGAIAGIVIGRVQAGKKN